MQAAQRDDRQLPSARDLGVGRAFFSRRQRRRPGVHGERGQLIFCIQAPSVLGVNIKRVGTSSCAEL